MMPRTVTIRLATLGDLAAVGNCATQAYGIYVERIGRKPAPMVAGFAVQIDAGMVHVAYCNAKIIGYVVAYRRADHLHVENVAVDPDDQGMGTGRQLMAFAEALAEQSELQAIELYTHEKMVENQGFYHRLGYREIDRRRENGFDRIYYRKEIASK